MKRSNPKKAPRRLLTGLVVLISSAAALANEEHAVLGKALVFHASFDVGPNAEYAQGDGRIFHAPALDKRQDLTPGLPPTGEVQIAEAGERAGRALHFTNVKSPVVCFKATGNFPSLEPGAGATVSFWLLVDPANDLAPGFCDPIQITSKQWDDASIFVEFEKRPDGIPFRLGVYADKAVWNPHGRKWEEIPLAEKPLVTIPQPPFAKNRWTHVAVTLAHVNSGQPDGTARLFLGGQSAGAISPRNLTFTWDAGQPLIMLGLGYAGKMDDLACFNRPLTPAEILTLHQLASSLQEIHPPKSEKQ